MTTIMKKYSVHAKPSDTTIKREKMFKNVIRVIGWVLLLAIVIGVVVMLYVLSQTPPNALHLFFIAAMMVALSMLGIISTKLISY